MVISPTNMVPPMIIGRTPSRSTSVPSTGADSDPPSIIADIPSEKLVRDQPNSPVIGSSSSPSAIIGKTVEPKSVPTMIAAATFSLRDEKSDSSDAPASPITISSRCMFQFYPFLARQRSSSRGLGSFASSSSLNCASMWKKAARATLSERFSQAWLVPR